MAIFKKIGYLFLLSLSLWLHGEEKEPVHKHQICYLMQIKEIEASINLYEQYYKELGKHDFEILSQMAHILLEEGAKSKDAENQLLSLFGSSIAGVSTSLDLLEMGIHSSFPQTQIASIHYLGQMQDDRSDELLIKAMSSNFFPVRMEAAYQLANRKHRAAVGQIEALMQRIPPPFRFYFPQFFALIGTSEAITILKTLIEDPYTFVRVESILAAARYDRDDLLPAIRAAATHVNIAEQEAAACALGTLKDSKSLSKLRRMSKSKEETVSLSAAKALWMLGDNAAKSLIIDLAARKNLYAIGLLNDMEEAKELLAALIQDPNPQVQLNATIAFLKLRDSRVLSPLQELLIKDTKDLGYVPQTSPGRALSYWRIIPSAAHQKQTLYDIPASTLYLKEHLLQEAIELPEKDFLHLALKIFESKESELIPSVVALVENLQTDTSIQLLEQNAHKAGAPLIRGYCQLALYRLHHQSSHAQALKNWIKAHCRDQMIEFRSILGIDQRVMDADSVLTPEENSRLLVDCYQALADAHEQNSIDLILQGIKEGHPKNRYVLAGLLLRALQ